MSLTASSRSTPGSLRQDVVIDGRHRLATDEPRHLGGDDTGPAPHELLPAALASCIATTLLMYARTKGWEIGPVAVDVDYDHTATPRRFAIAIRVGAGVDESRLARLEKVAVACPLRRALETGFVFDETIERGAAAIGKAA